MRFNVVRVYLRNRTSRVTARRLTLTGARKRIHSNRAKGICPKRGPWIEGYRAVA